MGFSLTTLKKTLSKKTKAELIDEISALCKNFPQIKEYYQAQTDEPKDVLKKYKAIIEKEFIEGKSRSLPKGRISIAKKAISDFKKLSKNPDLTSDLMLTFVESISWFSTEYGPDRETFYTSPENMFEKTLKLMGQNNLLGKYQSRAKKIVMNATDGWGHQGSLHDMYEDAYPMFTTLKV
jgi:hypothetical protein